MKARGVDMGTRHTGFPLILIVCVSLALAIGSFLILASSLVKQETIRNGRSVDSEGMADNVQRDSGITRDSLATNYDEADEPSGSSEPTTRASESVTDHDADAAKISDDEDGSTADAQESPNEWTVQRAIARLLDNEKDKPLRRKAIEFLQEDTLSSEEKRLLLNAVDELTATGYTDEVADLVTELLQSRRPWVSEIQNLTLDRREVIEGSVASPVAELGAKTGDVVTRALEGHSSASTRRAAARTLHRFSHDRSREVAALLRSAMSDSDSSVRRQAIRTLGRIAGIEEREALRTIESSDPDERVRNAATSAIKLIEFRNAQ